MSKNGKKSASAREETSQKENQENICLCVFKNKTRSNVLADSFGTHSRASNSMNENKRGLMIFIPFFFFTL